jgi:hypothetical protein
LTEPAELPGCFPLSIPGGIAWLPRVMERPFPQAQAIGPPLACHDVRIHRRRIQPNSNLGAHVGKVVRFIPKSDLDRARLIREARAIYERIFPPAAISEPRDAKE